MDSAERVFVYSERRMGKTSLIMNLRKLLDQKSYVLAYVDLFATESEESFATATAKALTNALESKTDRVLTVAKRLFSRFTPSLSVDEEGKPQLTLGMSRNLEVKESIEEVLRAPAKIAAETARKVIVVFDEFQRIMDYDSGIGSNAPYAASFRPNLRSATSLWAAVSTSSGTCSSTSQSDGCMFALRENASVCQSV
jgi:uncharacterized protein